MGMALELALDEKTGKRPEEWEAWEDGHHGNTMELLVEVEVETYSEGNGSESSIITISEIENAIFMINSVDFFC